MKCKQTPSEYLSVRQVAARLGLSKQTVRRLIGCGHLEAVILPGMTIFSVHETALQKYLSAAVPVEPDAVAQRVANLPDL